MLWEHEPQASVSTAFSSKFSLPAPSLRQQRVLVLCLHPVFSGVMIGDGDRKSLNPRAPWYGTIFLFLEQIVPSWRHISAQIHSYVGGSRVDVVTLPDQNGEFGKNLLKILHNDGRE